MKKRNLILGASIVSALFFTACSSNQSQDNSHSDEQENVTAAETTTFDIDATQSTVNWEGEMLGMYSHNGSVGISAGSVEMNGESISGGTFTIDMTSITPLDEGYKDEDGRRKEDLVGHLSSPDFFDIANFPAATFTIKNVDGNSATGTLNLRGNEGEEKVENITISNNNGVYELKGDITIDRKKYGAQFDMTIPDMVLSDNIKLQVSITTKA